MGYVKTGMGGVLDDLKAKYGISSVQVQYESGQKVATEETVRKVEENKKFLASLPRCNEVEGGYEYWNQYGQRLCIADPLKMRENEMRGVLRIEPPILYTERKQWKIGANSRNPYGGWVDWKWATPAKINPKYLQLLLRAQGKADGTREANDAYAARISWKMQYKNGEPYGSDRSMSESEIQVAFNKMMQQFSPGGDFYKETQKALEGKEGEQALRKTLAQLGIAHAMINESKEIEGDEDMYFCQNTMGLHPGAIPCCLEYVAAGKPGHPHRTRYDSYKSKVEKQDPSVMTCIGQKQQQALFDEAKAASAAQSKTLMKVAIGVGGVVALAAVVSMFRSKK